MSEVNSTVEYRSLPEYDGYLFGSDGSVWSCWKKKGIIGKGGQVSYKSEDWHRMRCSHDRDGYLKVRIKVGGERLQKKVHTLILEAFVGPCPPGMQCCHDPDRTRDNNAITNLRWDTPSGNQQDALKHGTRPTGISAVGRTFIEAWNSCDSLSEFCKKTGKTRRGAIALASDYRRQGNVVKFYPRPGTEKALAGERFGSWVVLKVLNGKRRLCKCDCGTERVVCAGSLTGGKSKTCGKWRNHASR